MKEKNFFQCYRTISQKQEGKFVIINLAGRVLEKIVVNDTLFAKEGEYTFTCRVMTIIAYGKSVNEIFPTMGCNLILQANDYLDNSINFLTSGVNG